MSPSPRMLSLEERVQRLENALTTSTQQRGGAPAASAPAIKIMVDVSATVGQVVRLFEEEWFLADSSQEERVVVGVVSRVVGSSPPTCEVVLWGLRYAVGTMGDAYYLSDMPGVMSTSPPVIGPDAPEATEEWTHAVEVQVTPNLRLVRPDFWKRRLQIVSTCETVEGEPGTPAERIFAEFTNEGLEE